ncbi:MAG TPA: glycosyltransferase family 2 protein [Thermoplasmata archaeon]|nr:glycosyltransferase family 2 protein [Thermoplasmata archaeon]
MPAELLRSLYGGIVAHNEEPRIQQALESLLGQELPPDTNWAGVCVVASGCTDRTADLVRARAARDPRIELVVQERREGKSAALVEVFRRAHGDALILLNGDARARPGAVAALLGEAQAARGRPLAVMGRPEPDDSSGAPAPEFELLWRIHHRFHAEELGWGTGSHLSDELMLLSLPVLPPLRPGVINDGAFIGVSLRRLGGELRYAPQARVAVAVPRGLGQHLRQRRRILYGHAQVRDLAGVAPTTLHGRAFRHPIQVMRSLVADARATPNGTRALVALATAEALASVLARIDRRSPDIDHTLWRRVTTVPPALGGLGDRDPVAAERTESA